MQPPDKYVSVDNSALIVFLLNTKPQKKVSLLKLLLKLFFLYMYNTHEQLYIYKYIG